MAVGRASRFVPTHFSDPEKSAPSCGASCRISHGNAKSGISSRDIYLHRVYHFDPQFGHWTVTESISCSIHHFDHEYSNVKASQIMQCTGGISYTMRGVYAEHLVSIRAYVKGISWGRSLSQSIIHAIKTSWAGESAQWVSQWVRFRSRSTVADSECVRTGACYT